MTIAVDIADRLYDYTDEEKAANAVAEFQEKTGLSDMEVIALWESKNDPRRTELDRNIIAAVDSNGTAKRAIETVPDGVLLFVSED